MTTHKFLAGGVLALVVGIASGAVCAAERYNELDDAAVAQARAWQAGGKAKALMSSDGKVIFAYGQSMPKLTCSPTRACDVEMEPNEKVTDVILGDQVNWSWLPSTSKERGKPVQHVVIQPKDKDLESNAIITTDRRTYHIKLYAPPVEGAYLNRMGFYYPEDMVTSWAAKAGREADAAAKEEGLNAMPRAVPSGDIDLDYRITGDADFKPSNVFNDGERVTMMMPKSLRTGEQPVFIQIDEKGNAMVTNYRREVSSETGDIRYVVDKLFAVGELRRGGETVKIGWKKKERNIFGWSSY